jgi:hypothetical protein
MAIGIGAAAAPAHASTAPAKQVGYAITQTNPTTYITPLDTAIPAAPLIAAWRICTRSTPTRCATGKGAGEQFQMQASGYSTFNRISAPYGVMFKTPNGLCPHAKDGANGWVVLGDVGCDPNNQSYQWFITTDNPNRLLNPLYDRYLGVLFNNQDGARTTTQPGTGAFYLGEFGS